MGSISDTCILLAGYSQPPEKTAASSVYNILSCQLLINKKSRCIVDSHFNTISPLTSRYLSDLVFGYCMDDPLEPLLEKLQTHLHLLITSSVVHCLRNAQERYRQLEMPD